MHVKDSVCTVTAATIAGRVTTVTPFSLLPYTHHLNLTGPARISQVVLAAAGGGADPLTPVDAAAPADWLIRNPKGII